MLVKKLSIFIFYIITAIFFWVVNFYYNNPYFIKTFYTLLALAFLYLIFKIILEFLFSKKIKDKRFRYSFKKTIHVLFLIISFVIILRIWIINPQALLVAYGLIAAGVAIALQDLFRNFAGGIIIFITSPFQVGHRIEINGKYGDVIDIGIMYTTLLEIREWVEGDQATGRICTFPNGSVLSKSVNNYTKDHNFLWDEFFIPIAYGSNWEEAIKVIKKIVNDETNHFLEKAQKNFSSLQEKYYVSKRNIEGSVYVSLTDNWIQMNIRYVVDVRLRRVVQASIMEKILIEFEKNPEIKISSETFSLVDSSIQLNKE